MPAPTGQLQRVIAAQRQRLLSGDARLQATIVARWRAAIATLDQAVTALQAQIASEGAATPGEVFALERWAELRRQMVVEIQTLAALTGQTVTVAQRQAVQLALADAQAQIGGALSLVTPSLAGSFARLPVTAVQDLIGSMQPGSPLHALFAAIATDAPGIAQEALATGLSLGQGPQAVAEAISKAINLSATRAMTLARNSMLNAYRSSSLRTYQANEDILAGWTWLASLSPQTCSACLFLHGSVHPLSESFFPNHVNCRCSPAPSVKGLPPLVQSGSGSDYFDGLSASEQDRILGLSGGAAYRAGELTLRDFLHVDDNPTWGRSYRQNSVAGATAAAQERMNRAA